ncbi:hypothetical protein Hypma_000815 [Hypsizygus marmoreus]|uniref:Glycosyltransferase 61 catalytic domain-containing protein n=1 Tax=Hypsizygus marmoreus TaxID=39966 RepID=A0A369JBJ0_HYPMA|nr:hypothetical protein Hypma_000815 [Hypsizygus marmoreus]
MAPATPTRREVVILALLLVLLLYVFRKGDEQHARHPASQSPALGNKTFVSPSETTHSSDARVLEGRLSWGSSPVPQTKVLAHVPGWTIFDKLYIFKGIVYIVTNEPSRVPDISHMYSKGLFIQNGKEAEQSRLPTDEDIRVISTKEAKTLFGRGANRLDGVSYFINDPYQFVTHYYHWSAELWFGFWRTYSSLDPTISENGTTTLPPVRRLLFNHLDAYHWRDYAAMNQWVIRSAFPGVVMEFRNDWQDRAEMARPFVFDRVVVADRSATMLSYNYARFQRTASAPFALPGSVNWWMTMRNNAIQFTGLDPGTGGGTLGTPVITYISRQEWGRRMLIKEDHERLVQELYKLRDQYGYEVNIVAAEKMSRVEQLQLAARTTIMMGVHGNGLTSLIWMKPNPRSTVIEFFFPGGFAFDYEYTTRALGMTHYGFWGSQSFTSPGVPEPKYVEGFQGNSIPLDGAAVARLCVERLTLTSEVDD